MNIFYLDHNPIKAASMVFDCHAVKMPLESLQIICTNINILLPTFTSDLLMKPTHANHPCTVWARESYGNFDWLYLHCSALFREYTKRYGRQHACEDRFRNLYTTIVKAMSKIEQGAPSPPALCMPDVYKTACPVESYRLYYAHKQAGEVANIARYQGYFNAGFKHYPDGKPVRKIARRMVWERTTKPEWAWEKL